MSDKENLGQISMLTHKDFMQDGPFAYQPLSRYWPNEDWFWNKYDDLADWYKPGPDMWLLIHESCNPEVHAFANEALQNIGDNLHENTGKSFRGLIKKLYHYEILDLAIQAANDYANARANLVKNMWG